MTKRDLLILAIKLFGLYSAIISLFSFLPNNILFAFEIFDATIVIGAITVFFLSVGLFWLLTFNANKLVDILKLDNGFADDKVDLGNIKATDIIKVGTFVIGGLLFINNIPGLLSDLFLVFKGEIAEVELGSKDKVILVFSGLKVLLGYLLFTKYEFVAGLLSKK